MNGRVSCALMSVPRYRFTSAHTDRFDLFGRGDAARRPLPMSAEDLLEAAVLIYLRGLGVPVPGRTGTP